MKNAVVVGAGPTGLFASSLLLSEGFSVDLYDQKKKAGRKLLLAGKSGLNITNLLKPESFATAYGCRWKQMMPPLSRFTPSDLRLWLKKLGVETFIGSSGRVFPVTLDGEKLLSLWMESLNSFENFRFHPEHRLINIKRGGLTFKRESEIINVSAPLGLLGLGGASYPSTGSDGLWHDLLEQIGIEMIPFSPMNCGFEYSWSPFFKKAVNYLPLKNIKLTYENLSARGEAMITSYGLEGGPFYRFSREIRKSVEFNGSAVVYLDLIPDLKNNEILRRLSLDRRKNSLSNHLRKQLNLSKVKLLLLRELAAKINYDDLSLLSKIIKKLPMIIEGTRPIEEAISSSGGVSFKELDDYFMIKKYPGLFSAGEMVDWDAPTGGYLLQGCFSTAYTAVEGIKKYQALEDSVGSTTLSC